MIHLHRALHCQPGFQCHHGIKPAGGTVHVPASIIGALLLGPRTNVTHQAMVLLTESGAATGDIDDLAGVTRRAMRDAFHESKLLTKCVQDIHVLLDAPGDPDEGYGWDIVDLWDDREGVAAGGRSWG